jgi:hypothetical protein
MEDGKKQPIITEQSAFAVFVILDSSHYLPGALYSTLL